MLSCDFSDLILLTLSTISLIPIFLKYQFEARETNDIERAWHKARLFL